MTRLPRPPLLLALGAALGLGLVPAPVQAHDARPVSVLVRQMAGDRYTVEIRAPESVTNDNFPALRLPANCRRLTADKEPGLPANGAAKFLMACSRGLDSAPFAIDYPLYNPSLSTLFRLESNGQPVRTGLLPPERTAWTVPARPGTLSVLRDYTLLGVRHIAAGLDHLLFVAGLLVLAGTVRRVLLAVTGFTLAHSLTLGLSVLDLVRLPSAPVEAVIALSILFLAVPIARDDRQGLTTRRLGLVAGSFGLLHGFGFAGALREVGLPPGEIAPALLGFNFGVELGQLLFIAGAVSLFLAVRGVALRLAGDRARRLNWSLALSYVIGPAAGFWLFARVGSFW